MALTVCSECNEKVSTSAAACPHCGATPDHFNSNEKVSTEEEQPKESIIKKILEVCLVGLVMYGCYLYWYGDAETESSSQASAYSSQSDEKNTFSEQQICRALIAAVFDHPLEIIKVDSVKNNVNYLSYTRPDDGKLWENKCKVVSSNVVIWGAKEGRWRNDKNDLATLYQVSGNKIVISEGGYKHTYKKSQF